MLTRTDIVTKKNEANKFDSYIVNDFLTKRPAEIGVNEP